MLGKASGNLAVIDIDDNELARWTVACIVRAHLFTRLVWTVSGNVHVYVREASASASTATRATFRERQVGVELKATGTQIASPPTPGYTLALDMPPREVQDVRTFWAEVAELTGVGAAIRSAGGAAGYPEPWKENVSVGERNRAAFVEACKLREARMPFEQAIDVMRVRWQQSYEAGGQGWNEMLATVRSAYSRGANKGGGLAARWRV